jgi:hypothetical protein
VRNPAFRRSGGGNEQRGVLKEKLCAELQDARVPGVRNDSKRTGVDLTTRITELSMVENVESFKAELKFLGLGNLGGLQQSHVPVIEARAVEEASAGIPELPKLFVAEQRRVEVGVPVAGIGVVQNGSATGEIRNVDRGRISTDQ